MGAHGPIGGNAALAAMPHWQQCAAKYARFAALPHVSRSLSIFPLSHLRSILNLLGIVSTIQAMAVTKAKEFATRFGAASLHLASTAPDQRVARAAELRAGLINVLEGATITAVEKNMLHALIVGAAARGIWHSADLSAFLTAIDAANKKQRRTSQVFLNILEFFADDNWARWKSNGVQGMHNTAVELINHIKSLGGKNLDEYSKKLVVSIYLFLRGDSLALGVSGRAIAGEYFKGQLAKSVRDFEPPSYMVMLPVLAAYKVQYPLLFSAAFPDVHVQQPTLRSAADVAGIQVIDGLRSCRGLAGNSMHQEVVTSTVFPQMTQGGGQSAADILCRALQQFQGSMGAFAHGQQEPHITYVQPTGRPMRSMTNIARLPSAQQFGNQLAVLPFCAQGAAVGGNAAVAPVPLEGVASGLLQMLTDACDGSQAQQQQQQQQHQQLAVATADALGASGAVPLPLQPPAASASATPGASDAHADTIAAVAKRMLARKMAASEDEGENSDGPPADDARLADDEKPRRNPALKRPAAAPPDKATPAPPDKATPAPPDKATPQKKKKVTAKDSLAKGSPEKAPEKGTWARRPSIGWEISRKQVMCRSGRGGQDSTHKISFKKAGSAEKAWQQAEKWLAKMVKDYESHAASCMT
jgi:hypothetical protein